MKLPDFDYRCPESLDEALAILASEGDGARPLSGGQSLIPMLAFRLASPTILVDLRKIPGLDAIEITDTTVRLGARVRWCDIEAHAGLAQALPLLAAAVPHIAHYQIRARGTVGGSLAHADPAAEFPGISIACDASIEIAGARGAREIAACDFFTGAMMTSLAADELIVGVRFARWPETRRWGFQEFAKRRGDFALAGIMLFYDLDDGACARDTHIAAIGAGDRPLRLAAAERIVNGTNLENSIVQQAAQAASGEVDPFSDLHADVDYRRALVATLVERAFRDAILRGARG